MLINGYHKNKHHYIDHTERAMKHLRKNQKKILKKKKKQKLRMPLKEYQWKENTGENNIYDCDRLMETFKN